MVLFPMTKGEQNPWRGFGAPLDGWLCGMQGRRSETREGLGCGLPSGREWEWRWERGWDGQLVCRYPACSRDLGFSVQGLGEKGGLDSPSLCKSCSAAAGRPQGLRVKAKPPGPRCVREG